MVNRRKTEMKQEYEREENQATTRKKTEKEREANDLECLVFPTVRKVQGVLINY